MSADPIELSLVADTRSMDTLLQSLAGADLFAIDTEFVRERTYFPELCVLQIASEGVVAAVDCLADIDLDALLAALSGDGATWLLHSARQDLEVLFQRATGRPGRLIDTQIAAALVGMPLQVGLQGLLQATLGVTIGKEHTRTDWSRRPLPDAALAYALDDVRYLLPAWRELEARLADLGRLAWLEEDCARQLGLPIDPEPAAILERTKGAGSLRGDRRANALALVAWREGRARRRDKPRRWILADDQLVAIATAEPRDLGALGRIPGLPPRLVKHSGTALLEALRGAVPVEDEPEPVAPDKETVRYLQREVRARAEALGIQPEILATRRDIGQTAAGRPSDAFVSGWRGSVLADLASGLNRA